MKWMRFRIQTNEESEDILISELADIGLQGAQIEDKVPLTAAEKEQMFSDDYDQPEGEDDGIAFLNFFAEIDENDQLSVPVMNEDGIEEMVVKTPDQIRDEIREILEELKSYSDIGAGTITVDVTEDIDWINNWKQYFHKFFIDDVLIIPSWEKISKEEAKDAKYIMHIDPGTAFGTGMHETTQLCIRQLKKYITRDTELLDVGTGSGVLSILALMFGAKHAVGTDLDPLVLPAVADNLKSNGIAEDKLQVLIGNLVDDPSTQEEVGFEKYDIVVANILPVVLVPLAPEIPRHLKQGGIYITSGIINEKGPEVRAAIEASGLEIIDETHQGEWMSFTARKN